MPLCMTAKLEAGAGKVVALCSDRECGNKHKASKQADHIIAICEFVPMIHFIHNKAENSVSDRPFCIFI